MVHIADKRIHAARQASTPLGHTLSLITHASSPVRFLILDCPTESTLPIYMQEFINNHVTTVVRCCQPTYETKRLNENNIDVVDLPFKDGGVVSRISTP
jgi:protein tyrosine phosphatase type 4A